MRATKQRVRADGLRSAPAVRVVLIRSSDGAEREIDSMDEGTIRAFCDGVDVFDDQPPVLGVVNKYRTASHLRFNLPPVVIAGDSR